MRFKVKNVSIITALVLALSLSFTLIGYAKTGGTVYDGAYAVAMDNSGQFSNLSSKTFESSPPFNVSHNLAGVSSWNSFYAVFTSNSWLPTGSRVDIKFSCTFTQVPGTVGFLDTPDPVSLNGYTYYTGSCIGGNENVGNLHLLASSTEFAYQFDDVHLDETSEPDATTKKYSGSASFTAEYDTNLDFQLGFVISGTRGWCTIEIWEVLITSSDGLVINVVENGFQNVIDNQDAIAQELIGGWSGSGMTNSNNQLGGALGDLDDMQQNADNDLHDALGDLESPTVDFNGNAVSFITSSVAMLWGSLGGFSAVLLCALFITVFNFISRYRGS